MRKGFTLVELVGVITLLGLIALITFPSVSKTLNNSRQRAYEEQIKRIEEAANRYSIENREVLPEMDGNDIKSISLQELNTAGYIQKTDSDKIMNPINKTEMNGCVLIQYDLNNNKYVYEYREDCTGQIVEADKEKPIISLNLSGTRGDNNWYKSIVTVTLNATDNNSVKQIKYCQGINCNPNINHNGSSKNVIIENSNETMVCAIAVDTNNNESVKACSETFKVDSQAPLFSGVSDMVIEQNSAIDLTSGVNVIDNGSGLVGTYTVRPTSIDTSTLGIKEVTYQAVDNAGNTRTITRRIVVNASAPNISFEVIDSIPVNGWYNEAFYIKAIITDKGGSGIKESYSCVSTSSSECVPNTSFTELEKTFYIDTQGSNRICIKAIDNNNKETTLCSDVYNLDAVAPTITAKNETIVVDLGEDSEVISFFNDPIYSISGGSLSCTIDNVSTLSKGSHEATCTVTGNNGLSATETITIIVTEQIVNYTMLYDAGDECTSLTGGWERYGYNSGVFQKNADHIYATGVGNSKNTNSFGTTNTINLTEYSKLHYLIKLSYEYFNGSNYFTWWNAIIASGKFNGSYNSYSNYLVQTAEYNNIGDVYSHSNPLVDQKVLYTADISNINNSLYPSCIYGNWGTSATFGLTMYSSFMTKSDNYIELANIASISATSINELLTESSTILNNENAVKYMLTQCTGDYMAAAIQSETFKTALESSPYKDMIYANPHWAKFLNM